VLGAYARVLLDVYARGARKRGIDNGHPGMVTALQRAGGGLNANLHFHTLVLDGMFSEGAAGTLAFHPAPAPSDAEVAAALATIRYRVQRLLVRRGLEPAAAAPGPADRLAEESPVLAGIVGASVQGGWRWARVRARVRRLGDGCDTAAVTSRGPWTSWPSRSNVVPLPSPVSARTSSGARPGVTRWRTLRRMSTK
jgi:hypothetical protein